MSDSSPSPEDLWRSIHGDLSSEETAQLHRLMEQDPAVKKSTNQMRALDRLLREAAADPVDEDLLIDRILQEIEQESALAVTEDQIQARPEASRKLIAFSKLSRLVAAAATIAVLVGGGHYLQQPVAWDISIGGVPQWRGQGNVPAQEVMDVEGLIEELRLQVEASLQAGFAIQKPTVEIEATHLPRGQAQITCRVFSAGAATPSSTIQETFESTTSATVIEHLASGIADALAEDN